MRMNDEAIVGGVIRERIDILDAHMESLKEDEEEQERQREVNHQKEMDRIRGSTHSTQAPPPAESDVIQHVVMGASEDQPHTIHQVINSAPTQFKIAFRDLSKKIGDRLLNATPPENMTDAEWRVACRMIVPFHKVSDGSSVRSKRYVDTKDVLPTT